MDTRNNDNAGNNRTERLDDVNRKSTTLTGRKEEAESWGVDKKQNVAGGLSQKMDGGNPTADEDSVSDEEIRRETLEKK